MKIIPLPLRLIILALQCSIVTDPGGKRAKLDLLSGREGYLSIRAILANHRCNCLEEGRQQSPVTVLHCPVTQHEEQVKKVQLADFTGLN